MLELDNRYFLIASLPTLSLENCDTYDIQSLYKWITTNSTKKDIEKINTMMTIVNIFNMRMLWNGIELFKENMLLKEDIEKLMDNKEFFPEYLKKFIDDNKSSIDKNYFSKILAEYFNKELATSSGFLFDYLSFQRSCRLVFAGLRSKKYNIDISDALSLEDKNCNLIIDIMMQKDHESYIPPVEFLFIKDLFENFCENPQKLQKEWLSFQFNYFNNFLDKIKIFSFDNILCYLAQLLVLLEYKRSLGKYEKNLGQKIVNDILAQVP